MSRRLIKGLVFFFVPNIISATYSNGNLKADYIRTSNK